MQGKRCGIFQNFGSRSRPWTFSPPKVNIKVFVNIWYITQSAVKMDESELRILKEEGNFLEDVYQKCIKRVLAEIRILLSTCHATGQLGKLFTYGDKINKRKESV